MLFATKFPQLTKKVWKKAIKKGKIKLIYPIIPAPMLTQEASTATAKARAIASLLSI